MSARFISVELSYGCQRTETELATGERPCVIAGPNGAGKTTLIEGIVRTLYGFNRKRPDDRTVAGRRRPWEDEVFTGRVVIERADGLRLEVRRDFSTDQVTVSELHPEAGEWRSAERFEGTASSGSTGRPSESYRAILDEWLGFGELDDYRRTMCIEQGELASTELSESLLQLAAGGHAALDAAKDSVRTAFRTLTREPMDPEDRRRPKDKQLELLQQEIRELDARLRTARETEKSRQPLRQEARDLSARAAGLTAKIRLLEDALQPLARLEKLREQGGSAEERLFRLERWKEQLGGRVEGLRRALEEWKRISAGPTYPDDFESRLAVLDKLWSDRTQLTRELDGLSAAVDDGSRMPRLPLSLVGVGAIALVSAVLAEGVVQMPLLLVAIAITVAGGVSLRAGYLRARDRATDREDRRRSVAGRLARVADDIAAQLAGVPDGQTLSSQTAPDRADRFRAQRAARDALARRRASLDELLDTIDVDLPSQGELPLAHQPAPVEIERAAAIAPVLDHEISKTRTQLAQLGIELEGAAAVAIQLPDGLEPSFAAVRAALEERRSEHRDVNGRLEDLRRRLLEAESGDSPVTIAEALDHLRAQEAELAGEADALRDAFELLDDAYSEFRAGDQERLLEAISKQLERVSGGGLGPVETDSVLEAAHVVVRGRKLPLDSPPLSFGELHAVLLAVRLGAADFLAGSGNRAPLLIDEPFTYLDDERAAQVWDQLREVARERQTIITTQARRLLDHLAVEPDVVLEAAVRVERPSD